MNALPPRLNDDQRIARMVTGMAAVFGVTLSDVRLRGYVEALADVPLDALQAGIKHAIVTWRYPDMPKPADVRAAVDRELASVRTLEDAPPSFGEPHYVCTNCSDSGWVITAERTDRKQPTAARCACYRTNPKLVAPKRFSDDDERRR